MSFAFGLGAAGAAGNGCKAGIHGNAIGGAASQLGPRELTEYCQWRKMEIAEAYSDVMSGAKGKRPALEAHG